MYIHVCVCVCNVCICVYMCVYTCVDACMCAVSSTTEKSTKRNCLCVFVFFLDVYMRTYEYYYFHITNTFILTTYLIYTCK